MTKPRDRARNRIFKLLARHGPIIAILGLAAASRLHGVGFGLPSLNDPDEPLFMLTAFDMLARGSVNPQWFGHPGTTTLYCLAMVIMLVGTVGAWSGTFADPATFAAAVYHDPAIVFLPARVFIVVNGVACVWLAYRMGIRLWGRREGIAAAFILAVNAIHIAWSQVIRTDVQASMFMQLSVLFALAVYRDGRMRDIVLSGVFAGFAVATKWPAATIVLCPLGAAAWRVRQGTAAKWLLAVPVATTLATLIFVSPFLLIDYATVIRDLSGEARPVHPGATAYGFIGNLAWYIDGPLLASFGLAGCALALGGAFLAAAWDRTWLVVVCPGYLAFAAVIATQHLIWERWLVPLLPFLALSAGWSAIRLVDAAGRTRWTKLATAAGFAIPLGLAGPMLAAAHTRGKERQNDTRQIASTWVRDHARPGATILVEHAAFDLAGRPQRVIFPLGSAGCVEADAMLDTRFSYSDIENSRAQAPVIDLGHVSPEELDTCRADYFVLSNFERYRRERRRFPEEYRQYFRLLHGAKPVYEASPRTGFSNGPVIEIFCSKQSEDCDKLKLDPDAFDTAPNARHSMAEQQDE